MTIHRNLFPAVLALSVTVGCFGKDGGDDDDDGGSESVPYGPENSWYHADEADEADVPVGLEGTGWDVGDIAPNWTLQDQHGDTVELYQFYGQVVVIDNFTEW